MMRRRMFWVLPILGIFCLSACGGSTSSSLSSDPSSSSTASTSETPYLTSLVISDSRASYAIGSTYINDNGLLVTAVYSDQSRETVASGYEIHADGFDPEAPFTTAGTFSLDVTYEQITSNELSITVIDPLAATAISIDEPAVYLAIGHTRTLSYSIAPANSTSGVTWSSDSPSIADVDPSTGQVNAISIGTAHIIVTTDNGLSSSSFIKVQSIEGDYKLIGDPSSLVLNSDIIIASGHMGIFYAMAKETGTDTRPYGSVSDKGGIVSLGTDADVASVVLGRGINEGTYSFYDCVNDGYLCAPSATDNHIGIERSLSANSSFSLIMRSGSAIIKAIAFDTCNTISWNGYEMFYACYTSGKEPIYLYQKEADPVYPSSVSIDMEEADIGIDDSLSLTATVCPSYANQDTITWQSEDESVAIVDSSGVVHALKEGKVDISASVITGPDNTKCSTQCSLTVISIPVTGISLPETKRIPLGMSRTLTPTFSPDNATNKGVEFSSDNPDVASVDETGTVLAKKEGSALISATSKDGGFVSTTSLTVEDDADEYTVMVYMCGSDLESYDADTNEGAATASLVEMLGVTYPESVNVIIETGGTSKWSSTLGIRNDELGRYHIDNGVLAKDESLGQASMGDPSTFQSFLEWGIEEYPARQTGVVLWDHGAGMAGCCYDENYKDSLMNSEARTALEDSFTATGLVNQKLDWIAYDCCLMSVADIADFNSGFFDYMIASEGLEPGSGWDYGAWLGSLADNPAISVPDLGKTIVDSFIAKCDPACDYATLSLLDLSQMGSYADAFEGMARDLESVIVSSNTWYAFCNVVSQCPEYTSNTFDIGALCEAVLANGDYAAISDSVRKVKDAAQKVVVYHKIMETSYIQNAYGLAFYCPTNGYMGYRNYESGETNFVTWRNLIYRFPL